MGIFKHVVCVFLVIVMFSSSGFTVNVTDAAIKSGEGGEVQTTLNVVKSTSAISEMSSTDSYVKTEGLTLEDSAITQTGATISSTERSLTSSKSDTAKSTANTETETITPEREYGQTCTTAPCRPQFICNVTCTCNSTFYWSGSACLARPTNPKCSEKSNDYQSTNTTVTLSPHFPNILEATPFCVFTNQRDPAGCTEPNQCSITLEGLNPGMRYNMSVFTATKNGSKFIYSLQGCRNITVFTKPTDPSCTFPETELIETDSDITLNFNVTRNFSKETYFCVKTNPNISPPVCEQNTSIYIKGLGAGIVYNMSIYTAIKKPNGTFVYSDHGCKNRTVVTRPKRHTCDGEISTEPRVANTNITFNIPSTSTHVCVRSYPSIHQRHYFCIQNDKEKITLSSLKNGTEYHMSFFTALKLDGERYIYSKQGCPNITVLTRPPDLVCVESQDLVSVSSNTSIKLDLSSFHVDDKNSTKICAIELSNQITKCVTNNQKTVLFTNLNDSMQYNFNIFTALYFENANTTVPSSGICRIQKFTRPFLKCNIIEIDPKFPAMLTIRSENFLQIRIILQSSEKNFTLKSINNSGVYNAEIHLSPGVDYNATVYAEGIGNMWTSDGCKINLSRKVPEPTCDSSSWEIHSKFVIINGSSCNFTGSLKVILYGTTRYFTLKNRTANLEFPELPPGRLLDALVTAIGENGKESSRVSVHIKTKPTAPKCSHVILETTNETIAVQHGSFFAEGADNFIIYLEGTNKTLSKSGPPVVYNGLAPGKMYNFYVISLSVSIAESFSDTGCNFTGYTKPNKPNCESIMMSLSTKNKLTLNVSEVYSDGAISYIVKYVTLSMNETVTFQTSDIHLYKSLLFGQNYTLFFYAIGNNNLSSEKCLRTLYTYPAKPSFATESKSAKSFVIEWQLPEGNSDKFNVNANCSCSNSLCEKCSPDISILGHSSANISNLLAGTHCNVSVIAIYESLSSAPFLHSIKTEETVPGQVKNLNYSSVARNFLTIQWEEPYCKNGDIYEYYLTIGSVENEQIATNTTAKNSFTFYGLNPGICYTVRVAAINGAGTGSFSSLTVSTIESVPEAVTMLKSTNLSSTSITVSWKKPFISNGVILKYELLVKEYKTSSCLQRILLNCSDCSFPCIYPESVSIKKNSLNKDSCFMQPVEMFSKNKEDFQHNVSNLEFFTQYNFEVVAYTSKGPGNVSLTTTRTSADLPPEPLKLQSRNIESNKLELEFQMPEKTNGNITNIMIEYQFNKHQCVSDESFLETKTEERNFTQTNIIDKIHKEILQNLYSYWNYSIKVKLGTYAGYGNYSNEINTRTLPSVPEEVANISVAPISATMVQVNWTKPCHPNGDIEFYQVTIIDEYGDTNGSTTIEPSTTSINIDKLLPFRIYQFNISTKVKNVPDQSTPRTSDPTRTKTQRPFKPRQLYYTPINATMVQLHWTHPSLKTGPTTYIVNASDALEEKNIITCTLKGFSNTSCIVSNLRPYWNYTLIVSATVESQEPSSSHLDITTNESTPGNLSFFHVSQEEEITAPRAIYLHWKPPSIYNRNGIIREYFVKYWPLDKPLTITTLPFPPSVLSGTIKKDVLPYKTYEFQMFARTIANASTKDYVHGSITIDAGAPLPSNLTSTQKLISVGQSGQVSNDEKQLSVYLNHEFLCSNKNGNPESWYIIVAEESTISQELLSPFHNTITDYQKYIEKKYKSWAAVHDQDHFDPYIATNIWKPSCKLGKTRHRREIREEDVQFIVGLEGECENKPGYCNGYLKPKTKYKVRFTVCTNVGCLESEFSTPLETEPNLLPAILVPSVVVPVALACIVILLVMKRMKKGPFKDKTKTIERGSENDGFSTELEVKNISKPRPVKITEFAEHVQKMHADSNMIFSSEYKLLKEESPVHTTKAAELQVNRIKNRYTNILSYDHSRVKLLPTEDDEGSDYVNANYIPGYSSPREYIATQGPLPFTRDDFWRMIWEQNVSTIVMLTQLVERGRRKCDIYWPETTREPVYYGDLVVEVESESTLPDYVLRVLSVKLGNRTRKVKQLHYLKWPDMGCPETTWLLLNFVGATRMYLPHNEPGPIVVHCSAGVGRTGTFIAVDYLMQHVTTSDVIDIFGYVMKMRNNRPNMVQTEDQYIFIHDCISDFINKNDDDSENEEEDQNSPIYANM